MTQQTWTRQAVIEELTDAKEYACESKNAPLWQALDAAVALLAAEGTQDARDTLGQYVTADAIQRLVARWIDRIHGPEMSVRGAKAEIERCCEELGSIIPPPPSADKGMWWRDANWTPLCAAGGQQTGTGGLDALLAAEGRHEEKDQGAELAAVENDTGSSTTETASVCGKCGQPIRHDEPRVGRNCESQQYHLRDCRG